MAPLPTAPGARGPQDDDDNENVTSGSLPTTPGARKNEDWRANMKSIEEHVGAEEIAKKPKKQQDQPIAAYISVGQMSAKELLDAEDDILDDLRDEIKEVVSWVQGRLREDNLTESLAEARREGGAIRNEIAQRIDSLILQYMNENRKTYSGENSRSYIIASAVNEIIGLGPIEPLWQDPDITEIMVNGPFDVQVEIKGKIRRVPGVKFRDVKHLEELCVNILGNINRTISVKNPIEDGRLPDMSRVHVVHQAIAPNGPNLTIRRHRAEVWSVEELVERGSFTPDMAVELAHYIHSGCSTVVVGGTGTGKTTILNAISGLTPFSERIVTIEDNLELILHPDRLVAAPMEARPAGANGQNAISIRDLVKASLRMRPDRIIVGEVRDSSAYDMLQAMNTGHNGSMTTIHANGAEEAIPRLVNLVGMSGEINSQGALALIAGAVDLLVVVVRFPEDGSRRLQGIYEVPSHAGLDASGSPSLEPIPLWEFEQDGIDPETGAVIGHYERKNDPSPILVHKHRLDKRHKFTLEEVYEMSRVPKGETNHH